MWYFALHAAAMESLVIDRQESTSAEHWSSALSVHDLKHHLVSALSLC